MKHDEFVGHVQHRAELPSRGDAEAAIRATLTTLAERLQTRSAAHLASQLPPELGLHLHGARRFEHLTADEFFERVALREGVRIDRSIAHVRAVFETLEEAISPGAMKKLRRQIPEDLARELFTPVARMAL